MLVNLLVVVCLIHVRADYFLREPNWIHLNEEDHLRSRRAIPEWLSRLREKAVSFGQSNKDKAEVDFYMVKLNELAEQKHPSGYSNDVSGCL